jgi:hypothetical protein
MKQECTERERERERGTIGYDWRHCYELVKREKSIKLKEGEKHGNKRKREKTEHDI